MFDFFGMSFGNILLIFSLNLIVFLVLFRKFLISKIEPLSLFIISQSFTLTLSFMTVHSNEALLQIIISHLVLYLGFRFSYSSMKVEYQKKSVFSNDLSVTNMKIFEVWIIILFLITIVSNIYQFSITGIALLDLVPTAAKVSNYSDGLGIIRRINWGIGTFSSIGLFMLYFSKQKKIYIYLLIVSVVISVLGGSKSSLVQYLFIFTAIATQMEFKINLKKYKRTIVVLSVLSVIVVLLILNKDSGNSENPFVGLFRRLLYYGDVVLYYYDYYIYDLMNQKNILDYIIHLVNPITGFLRIDNYQYPLGYEMVSYFLNRTGEQLNAIVGPNTPFYVKGNMFFGLYGGFVYSFIIGCVIGLLRKNYLRDNSKNIFIHAMKIWFFVNCFTLATEDTLFISMLWDLLIFSIPTLVISIILVKSVDK